MTPMMRPAEWEFLRSYLKKDMIMLEYGSGHSTRIYSNYVKTLYSIEHHYGWYHKIKKEVRDLDNVNCVYVPPNIMMPGRMAPSKKEWFIDYINWPKTISQMFDIVMIDGRARQWVAESILGNITENSLVFLHDYTDYWPENKPRIKRRRYNRILNFYDIVDAQDTLALLRKK